MRNFIKSENADYIDYLVANSQTGATKCGYADTNSFDGHSFVKDTGFTAKDIIKYTKFCHIDDFTITKNNNSSSNNPNDESCGSDYLDCHKNIISGSSKNYSKEMVITYGYFPTILGNIMVATTQNGVCYLGFAVNQDNQISVKRMKRRWPYANYLMDNKKTEIYANKVMDIWLKQRAGQKGGNSAARLKLDLYGSKFQFQVWQALLKIPFPKTLSYSHLAAIVGNNKATRAVANAVGANPVSLLIPCHRVIRSSGEIDNYGWGNPRKKLILALERTIL